jgi:hypothetical protein
MFLVFRYIGHIFIAIGDHPDELGNQVVEALRRVGSAEVVFLSVRSGGFH